jgi:hypothetical protein
MAIGGGCRFLVMSSNGIEATSNQKVPKWLKHYWPEELSMETSVAMYRCICFQVRPDECGRELGPLMRHIMARNYR